MTQARLPSVFDNAFLIGVEGVTEVYLIRHGQQQWSESGFYADNIDPPLSEHGRKQAELLGAALSVVHFDAIYSSRLKRAHETASAVAKHHRLDVEVIEDLREVEVFRDVPADKKLSEYLGADLLDAVRTRMLNERNWDVYPYGESSHDFKKRAINAVETAIARRAGERIAVVCHGGVINAYVGHIVASPIDMFFRPGHTSVTVVAAGENRRVLHSLNDEHHLRTQEGHFSTY